MMKRTSILLTFLPLVVFTACGGSVAANGTTTSSGSGGSGSTSSTTGSTSSSGSTSTSTGSSTSTSSSSTTSSSTSTSSSTTGGPACVGSAQLMVGDAPVQLPSNCASDTWGSTATTPVGYVQAGGASADQNTLVIFGCVSAAAGSQGIVLSAPNVTAPGTFTGGTATYTDMSGNDWTGTPQVVVTTLGAVGDTIEGTFTASVTHPPSQIAENVTGTFSVCRIGDQLTP
jgi:hypothetical protein